MDLRYNQTSLFTRWVVRERLLTSPVVVVDVGVQGGESIRWGVFGPYVDIHGFDPLPEVVDKLKAGAKGNLRRHYHCMALGDEDKETRFYVNDASTYSSSMYQEGPSRFGAQKRQREIVVPMRRLDTLLADGVVPPPDFIKVDVEGFEKFVLLGARRALSTCLGAELETSLAIAESYPKSHLVSMQEILIEHHMLFFDLNFDRVPRGSFQDAIGRYLEVRFNHETMGRPGTINALFCRDPVEEHQQPHAFASAPQPMSPDQIIKTMMIFESYGLNDVAVDIATYFRDQLASRLDVDTAIELLVRSAAQEYDVWGPPQPGQPHVDPPRADPRHISLQIALREGASDVGLALLHSLRHGRLSLGQKSGHAREPQPDRPRVDPRHVSLQVALREGVSDVGLSLLHSLRRGRLSFRKKSGHQN